jgi:ABC-type nitrate/sulfonate/bicarbonate transport system ATPase subunit
MLAILIARAKEAGHVEGIIPHLIQDGLSIVQYADDTVIFMSHDVQKAVNMKLILTTFEKLSGLKINYQKSKIFVLVRRKNMRTTIPTYLAVIQANSLFVILAC